MTTSTTDVLQIFTVLKHGKLRGCENPIGLIKAKSASDFLIFFSVILSVELLNSTRHMI